MTRIRTAFRKVSSTRTSAGYFSSYVTISHTTTSPTSRKTSLSAGRIGTCNGSPIVSFILPAMLGFLWNEWPGAFGAFLVAGVARIVVLQHCTFLINSACHTIGRQPYSTKYSAGDSFFSPFSLWAKVITTITMSFSMTIAMASSHGRWIQPSGLSGCCRS